MATNKSSPTQKPLLRGHFHQAAFFTALGAGVLLIAKATTPPALVASTVYILGLLLLFGVSALYHRPHWDARRRAFMKRLDHSAIFVFIAGTTTPLALLALDPVQGRTLLIIIWAVAVLGIFQSIFWMKAPKWITAIFYVSMGWISFPYARELKEVLGTTDISLIATGGILYTIGAVGYALRRPIFNPKIYGYHEMFHALTIVAAICHFIVIYHLIR